MITIRRLDTDEVKGLAAFDRTERVTRLYSVENNQLTSRTVELDVPPWDADHVGDMIRDVQDEMVHGAWAWGAFDGDDMGGLACIGGNLIGADGDLVQLVLMHVSKAFRRQGIASRLFDLAVARARELGAWGIYISATPSNSALGFYVSRGAGLASDVIPELYECEPDDIHLVLPLENYAGHEPTKTGKEPTL